MRSSKNHEVEQTMRSSERERAQLLELLAKHGRNLHSFMVLEPGLSVWFTDDAAVAYAERGGYWVAVGGPLCASEQTVPVAHAFLAAAREAGCKVVFFGVTQPLVDRLAGTNFDSLLVGLAAVWNPAGWTDVIRGAVKLRNRLNKASHSGVVVRLLPSDELAEGQPLRSELVNIVNSWADHKALPLMGFMVTLELFQHSELRRYFVVESDGTVQGFAVCVPIFGRKGWLLEDMIMRPTAPSGSSEALVDAVMRRLCDEGAQVVSLGMVALAGLDAGESRGRHPILTWMLRFCSRTMGWLYNFEGLYRFRNKMKPSAWEKVYIVSSGPVSFWTIRAILMAFANGWVPRFGVRVLGRWSRKWLRRMTSLETQPVQQGSWIDVRTSLLALACWFTTVVAVIGAIQGWLPWWASIGLGFLASFVGFTPVHEAVHGNVCRVKAINDAVGSMCSILLTGALGPYRFLHREHHLHTNVASKDPDHWCGEGPRWALPLRWFTQDIGYLFFYLPRWRTRPWTESAELLLFSCLYVGIAASSLLLNPIWFYGFCMGWFIPARLALFALAATFSWLPHEPHTETDRYRATTVRSSSWLNWALLGQNYHLVHHLNPKIPFHKLASTWRQTRVELLEQGARDKSQASSPDIL